MSAIPVTRAAIRHRSSTDADKLHVILTNKRAGGPCLVRDLNPGPKIYRCVGCRRGVDRSPGPARWGGQLGGPWQFGHSHGPPESPASGHGACESGPSGFKFREPAHWQAQAGARAHSESLPVPLAFRVTVPVAASGKVGHGASCRCRLRLRLALPVVPSGHHDGKLAGRHRHVTVPHRLQCAGTGKTNSPPTQELLGRCQWRRRYY